MNDKTIKQTTWNRYLKKYSDDYKVYRNDEGIWTINCKYGFIQPYSIKHKQLIAVLTYKTQRGVNILLKKFSSDKAPDIKISQLGDFEVSIVFDEKDVVTVAELLHFRVRRHMTEEQRQFAIENLKNTRKFRKNTHKLYKEDA